MQAALEIVSLYSTQIIAVLGGVHVLLFAGLWLAYRRNLRGLAALLDDFTRTIRHRSVLDRHSHLSDQIEAFLADVNDVLSNPQRTAEQKELLSRMRLLDEKRRYVQSMGFDISYNVLRSMIEAYPLLGILGTILAIGLVVQTGDAASVGLIVQRFGEAIWSTCAGLVAALALMLMNSIVEPPFLRLSEQREQVRQMVGRVKGLLTESMAVSGGAG